MKYKPDLRGKETFALMGASYMILAAEGLKRTGRKLTRERFCRAMEKIKNFTPENLGPKVTFGPERHHGLNTVRLMKAISAKDKKIEQITDYQFFPAHF